MSSEGKFLAGLLIGAAAGAAVVMLLGSDKGKQFVSDLKSAAGKAGDELKTAFGNFEEDVKDTVQKAKEFARDMEEEVVGTKPHTGSAAS